MLEAAANRERRPCAGGKAAVLRDAFGFTDFRPGQEEVIDAVLAGRNALSVMPTGAGKSLCYQLPALVLGGLTIVVSPLIALMDDQVAGLRLAGQQAGAIHSGRSRDENVAVWRAAAAGDLSILYMSPERLMTDRMLAALSRLPITLVAIDEAHCVSQWGHSFRADYLELGRLREAFPGVPILALTATADDVTREDIAARLFGGKADIFVAGFDRPNISLSVVDKTNAGQQIESFVTAHAGQSGIVYRLSRKKVEDTAARLSAAGIRALPYHAGLDAESRTANQETFLAEPGVVMVATIAFGMGIDKSDVRYVVHGEIPGSLEAYYQEIGRAGRDGAPAEAFLLYGLEDIRTRRRFIDEMETTEDRKRVEARRLDAMVGFCEAATCRRATLLDYFGETTGPCGNCDTCLDPPTLVDGTGPAKTLLSLVRDTGETYGAGYLVSLLMGQESERAMEKGHHRLAEFGAGLSRKASEWRAIVRQLVAAGALVTDAAGFGSLRITRKGAAVMQGEDTISLRPQRKPSRRRERAADAPALDDADMELLGRLKALRRELAAERSVPAYVVFSDRTLEEMARLRPGSLEEMARVRGVGAAKLESFGSAFLEAVRR